mgnify:CR=1 FL=1
MGSFLANSSEREIIIVKGSNIASSYCIQCNVVTARGCTAKDVVSYAMQALHCRAVSNGYMCNARRNDRAPFAFHYCDAPQ